MTIESIAEFWGLGFINDGGDRIKSRGINGRWRCDGEMTFSIREFRKIEENLLHLNLYSYT